MHDRPLPSSTQAPLRKQPTQMQGFLLQAAGIYLVALVMGSMALECSSCRPTTTGPAPAGITHPTCPVSVGTLKRQINHRRQMF